MKNSQKTNEKRQKSSEISNNLWYNRIVKNPIIPMKRGCFTMINYTTLAYQLKREILKYSKKICKGLTRPEFKFITNMFYGILESNSCHLSKISRALGENITLKKTIERLSRNLSELDDAERMFSNYIEIVQKETNDRTIFVIDESDVSKPYSVALEAISKVRDGSTGEITKGYHLLEMTALLPKHKMPMPVYEKEYTSAEDNFESQPTEVLEGLKVLTKTFGKKGIRALDRGYDNLEYYKYFITNSEKFVIRAKQNRNIVYRGETLNILDVAKKYKGKYSLPFTDKKGKKLECKVSIIPVALPKYPNAQLNLVVVYGFGAIPMMLLSNLNSEDNRLALAITKVYLMRWRIEEYYRFVKQQFEFENFRVRSLKSIRNLNTILTILVGLIGIMSEKQGESKLVMEVIAASKRIYGTKKKNGKSIFLYYAVADGIFNILQKCKDGIRSYIEPLKMPRSTQLCFAGIS